jgi:hypothetical protein
MITVIAIVAIVLFSSEARSQSYEGDIDSQYPVWFDLSIPSSDGHVKGTYFYKKYGVDLRLSGIIKGTTLSLKELGQNEKVTGMIDCLIKDDSIVGTWKKPGGRSGQRLHLKKTDPRFKKYAKAINGKELTLARDTTLNDAELYALARGGRTLADALNDSGYVEESGKPIKGPLDLEVYCARNDVLSTSFHWGYFGAYYTGGNTYHTFNLLTGREILLWEEIDESQKKGFNRYLNEKIMLSLAKLRKEFPDSEWAKAFESDSVGAFFKVDDVRKSAHNLAIKNGTNYSIDSLFLHYKLDWYFDFAHIFESMDAMDDLTIPLVELKKYLKKESVLRKLISD